jgi:hypothetical protein
LNILIVLHFSVKEGLGGVIERLGVDLQMEMNSVVEKIGYDEEGAAVTYLQAQPIKSPTNGTQQQQEAAMIRKTISVRPHILFIFVSQCSIAF